MSAARYAAVSGKAGRGTKLPQDGPEAEGRRALPATCGVKLGLSSAGCRAGIVNSSDQDGKANPDAINKNESEWERL